MHILVKSCFCSFIRKMDLHVDIEYNLMVSSNEIVDNFPPDFQNYFICGFHDVGVQGKKKS